MSRLAWIVILILSIHTTTGCKKNASKSGGSRTVANADFNTEKTDSPVKDRIVLQAKQMYKSIQNGDFETMADATHPSIIDMLGGRAAYVKTTRDLMTELKISNFNCGVPSDPVGGGSELFSVIPTTGNISDGKDINVSFNGGLIAISSDGGQTWKFLDTAGFKKDMTRLKQMLPNFPSGLTLP
ncbi:hypothetical protein BH11PLA2_BH11PLA2_18250 [soil metagenome]